MTGLIPDNGVQREEGFHRYVKRERIIWEQLRPLINGKDDDIGSDSHGSDIYTYIFISNFNKKNKANQCRRLGSNENPVNTATDKKQVMEFSTTGWSPGSQTCVFTMDLKSSNWALYLIWYLTKYISNQTSGFTASFLNSPFTLSLLIVQKLEMQIFKHVRCLKMRVSSLKMRVWDIICASSHLFYLGLLTHRLMVLYQHTPTP